MKTKKTSLFKKALSVTMVLALLMSCMAVAMTPIHAYDSIEYLKEGDKRLGIKQITIDGQTYYDIDGGKSTIDPDEISPIEFYKKAMLADYNGYSAIDLWANIASQIYEDAGSGIGYSREKDFDQNLVEAFGKNGVFDKDGLKTTGWTVGTKLSAAHTAIADEFQKEFSTDVSRTDFLDNTTGSDNGEGLAFFNTDEAKKDQPVLYNIATNGHGSGYTRYYQGYGIAFYDFQLIPLADDELAFITAAEGYENLEAAEEAGAPGVEYNQTGGGAPNTSFVTNPSATDSVVSASYSENSSTTFTNYMESTETYTFGQSTDVSTEFGASFPLVADAKVSVSVGFSAEQAISTAYGEEESYTNEVARETVAEVNLPAHTQFGISQESGSAELVFTYDCPVYLTYKVVIFGLNAEFYWDSVTGNDIWATTDYDQGSICVAFGSDSSTGGLTGVQNLYNRAVRYSGMNGFEESYGNNFGRWEHQGDGDGAKSYNIVKWSSFLDDKAPNSNLTTKEVVNRLYKSTPLSASGGKMSVKSTSQNTEITPIIPLYDLDYVQVDGGGVYTIAPGGSVDFGKISTSGYNKFNVPYYGYIGDGGSWVLCDADGNEQTAVDGATLDDVSNYQRLTATEEGTYYAKFLIDETLYNKVDSTTKIKNADLSSTPIVTIKATATGLDHICSEGPWQTVIAATCTTTGEQVANCVTCNRPMYTQVVPVLKHIPITITTPATCQSEGKITEICGNCLGLINSETTPKLDHVPGEWVTTRDETCVNDGAKQQNCVNCKTLLDTEAIPAHGHDEGEWVTVSEAGCEVAGEKIKLCTICDGIIASETVEAHGHFAGEWIITKDATCEVDGEKLRYCTVCDGVVETGVVEKHGHAPAWITVKEATCSAVGREEYVCTICKAVLETKEIGKLEHIPGKWEITKDSSCTQEGLKQQTCALCGALIGEAVVIPAHDHQTGDWVTILEPGCETEGEKIKSCTICNGTIVTEAIPALGHTEGVWVTALEATCETQGEQHKSCTRCGKLIESKRLEALGHTPGPAMTCVTDQVCLVCEEVLVPADGRSHVWTEWATYKPASFFVEEQQRRECSSCYLEEYRFVKGTSGCHKYFPHCDGSGEDCWACETLSNTNGFFRNLGKFLTWFFFENLITNILFPFSHDHFHEMINLDQIFGS